MKLQQWMDEAGLRVEFSELDPFGERHDSWQRTLHKYIGKLDRYVVVAHTSFDDYGEVTAMAGAEERTGNNEASAKFRRFEVGSIRLYTDNSYDWPQADLKKLIDQAFHMAIAIEPLQLEERQRLAS